MRRSGRSMNRKDKDRGGEMRLTERTRKLIPETRGGVPIAVHVSLNLYASGLSATCRARTLPYLHSPIFPAPCSPSLLTNPFPLHTLSYQWRSYRESNEPATPTSRDPKRQQKKLANQKLDELKRSYMRNGPL